MCVCIYAVLSAKSGLCGLSWSYVCAAGISSASIDKELMWMKAGTIPSASVASAFRSFNVEV